MKKTIWLDMDGTIADLYNVPNWLSYLEAEDAYPYKKAGVMHNMSLLARLMNRAQKSGYELGIISWLSKTSTPYYDTQVTSAKLQWLAYHLPSVHFNKIYIVAYGTPKSTFMQTSNDILIDDEERNRKEWTGVSYHPTQLISILKTL